MEGTKAKLVKADSAEAAGHTLRTEIAALRTKCEVVRRILGSLTQQVEQVDECAAKIEQRLVSGELK